ncbi:hypothetical protein LOTGIDRAFT_167006 [Lottia gigantea]|uniref:VOC domain-containing protein n=1 Tax=Lottia gigantea TaxID=225164 RepID=V3ZV83_LOTGI|nr:hypothetical protein LOTGIDRAFT_167006 [Lottia gigantea]ESO86490.1 hypothetical protein LOTGIDRAFT_167006 [Lottia gigantea]
MRVENGIKVVEDFVLKYGFTIVGERIHPLFHQWMLEVGMCRFLITEVSNEVSRESTRLADDVFISPLDGSSVDCRTTCFKRSFDIVNDVALEVKDVETHVRKLSKNNVVVLKPLRKIADKNGEILIVTVKSCLDNIIHTLIQIIHLKGKLLPGFSSPSSCSEALNRRRQRGTNMSHVDHVTFVCESGKSPWVISWYEKCFGMKKFSLNRHSDDGSLVVNGNNSGLRLSAFDYWKCSETGLFHPEDNKFTFVLAEPIGRGQSHVKTFLSKHEGAGVQHVGLHTSNMVTTLQILKNNGVQFVEPPFTYYEEEYFLKKVDELGDCLEENVEDIISQGILLDSENTLNITTGEQQTEERYLMQKFTKPIFKEETFFLEIIQRHGATGFGFGNVMALCRAVEKLKCTKASG